jgi:glyoxylase-like metal-dependent hydrolase (beta-lactamase superfamily II)
VSTPTVDRSARFDVLVTGSVTDTGGGVISTCSLIRDGDRLIVVDPGMASDDDVILRPLRALGVEPRDVTDVVLSHHHPDHTMRVALFPNAAVHDHWATYRGIDWEDADAEGRILTPSVALIRVPGHTAQDIAVVAGTEQGTVVFTHAWWDADGPPEDPTAEDPEALRASRRRIRELADRIVPGHGEPFTPDESTPA